MEEKAVREFLIKSGLKPKEIAGRLQIVDRTVHRYLKGDSIPPSICKLVEYEFSDYDIESGERKTGGYTTTREIIEGLTAENEELKKKLNEANEMKTLQSDLITSLKEQLNTLRGNNSQTAAS